MKKVYMRYRNDCLSACLATILGLEIEDVPRFLTDDNKEVEGGFHESVAKFLDSHGFTIIEVPVDADWLRLYSRGFIIVNGLSYTPEMAALGYEHAVVYCDGQLWHDPNANATDVIEPKSMTILVPLRPSELTLCSSAFKLLYQWSTRAPNHEDIIVRDKLLFKYNRAGKK